MNKKTINICTLFILIVVEVTAQTSFHDQPRVKLLTPYEKTDGLVHYRYDSVSYEQAHTQKEFDFVRLFYNSDGYEVEAFICEPAADKKRKYPVIIYNRGGTGNYGKISESDFPDFYWLAKRGFIVIASNYRFTGENGPRDQLGGDEIADVINLHRLLPSIQQVDTANIFMMGISRGGLMTYKTISQVHVNAAAVIGGVSNYFTLAAKRPEFLDGWNDLSASENYRGLRNILPQFETNKERYLTERSPVKWADRINCPVLILHSRQDGFVTCDHAFEMALALAASGKRYQLKIYDEKSHSLPYQYFDSFEEIIYWFQKFMK